MTKLGQGNLGTEINQLHPIEIQLNSAMQEEKIEDRAYLLATLSMGFLRGRESILIGQPKGQQFEGMRGQKPIDGYGAKMFYTPGQVNLERGGFALPQPFPGNWLGNVEPDISWGETESGLLLTRVDQNRICRFDLDKKVRPLALLNMTLCSSIVAKSEKHLWVAHIGYSQMTQFEGVFKHLETEDPQALNNLMVFLNVGPYPEDSQNKTDLFNARAATREEVLFMARRAQIYEHNYHTSKPTEREIVKWNIPSSNIDYYYFRRNVRGLMIGDDFISACLWHECTNVNLKGAIEGPKEPRIYSY